VLHSATPELAGDRLSEQSFDVGGTATGCSPLVGRGGPWGGRRGGPVGRDRCREELFEGIEPLRCRFIRGRRGLAGLSSCREGASEVVPSLLDGAFPAGVLLGVEHGPGSVGGGLCGPVDGVGSQLLQAPGDPLAVLVGGGGRVLGGVGQDRGSEVVPEFRACRMPVTTSAAACRAAARMR
jgi:hypothetical protein